MTSDLHLPTSPTRPRHLPVGDDKTPRPHLPGPPPRTGRSEAGTWRWPGQGTSPTRTSPVVHKTDPSSCSLMRMRTLALMAAATVGIPTVIYAMVRVGMRTPTPQPGNSGEGGNEQGGRL